MRPRSRLLAKKRLPTIREGHEELLQDMNQANTCHSREHLHSEAFSSEAYLRSICQLARPAFPLQEPDCDILALGRLDSLGLRPPRVLASARPLTPTTHRYSHRDERRKNPAGTHPFLETASPEGVNHDSPDPLEYLYGRHQIGPVSSTCLMWGNKEKQDEGRALEGGSAPEPHPQPRAYNLSRLCSPRLTHRKSNSFKADPEDNPAHAQCCLPKETKTSAGRLPSSWRPQVRMGSAPSGGRDKQSMISHWIADCRCAWREARARSCMLPAIVEM